MQIKISHSIWNGTSIAFSFWRRDIAVAAGIVAEPMDLYSKNDKIPWKEINKLTDYTGYWKAHPGDPIWFILAHDHSTGYITANHAGELAMRLETLLDKLPGKESYPNQQTVTKKIIKGLKDAATKKEEVTFE